MSSHKELILMAIVLIATAVNASTKRLGSRSFGDTLVCYGDVHLARIPGRVVSATRICDVPDIRQYITYIEAKDLSSYGRGGYAQVTGGGPGRKSVTIYLWSQPGQPLDFSFNVFGKIYR